MGVSFKISRTGTRFKPKPVIPDSNSVKDGADKSLDSSKIPSNNESNGKDEDAVGISDSSLTSGRDHISAEDEVSFVLNLYPDRYSIGKPSENDNGLHAAFQGGSKLFLPYDRTSEGLFAAIECGRLPGGILDDIPCKYVEGAIICEIRDYRKCISDNGFNTPSVNGSPTITKVRLKMSLENVVKDIPLMADDSWTYGDRMEVESRILKALQPKLCLDPTPKLDKLSENPVSVQLNLGLAGVRKRRLRQVLEVTVTASNRLHGKKLCIDRVPESSGYRTGELGPPSADVMSQHVQDNAAVQGPGNQRNMHDPMQGPAVNICGASPAGQDMSISYTENINPAGLAKMESQEGQLSPYSNLNKRARLVSGGPDGAQQQQFGSYMDGLQGPDMQWKNQLLQQHQNARGIQYANPGMQKYPQLVGEGVGNQDSVKLEKPDSNLVKSDIQMMETEGGHMDPRPQPRLHQQSVMRPSFHQSGWTSLGQQVEKDARKEDQFQKRKSIQSPRLLAGTVAQSPLSAKSAELSGGSMGAQYGAVSSAASLGHLQREKSAIASIPAVERTASMTSSANDSVQPQHQAQLTAKRRSNSFSKNPGMSGVGSPVSVNTMGGPMNASSPSISTPQLTEQSMIERFAKIEVVAMRHQLNCKKNKVDEYPRKPRAFSKQELLVRLSTAANNEYVKDETCTKPMSESLVGGSMNVCKIRVLHVQPERTVQGNMIPVSPTIRTRMIMSEKPNDGTVAMHYGDLEDGDYLNAEDYLPTLPNTHLADLLAAQFCALMIREGYFVEDHIQPRPPRISVQPTSSQPNTQGVVHNNNAVPDVQQYSESVSGQQTAETKPPIGNASMASNPNLLPNPGMLPPGSTQALQMSQGLVSGVSMAPKQEPMDPQQPLQQQPQPQQQLPLQNQPSMMPQQQPHFQRSSVTLPANSMPQLNSSFGQSSNLPLGNMGNRPSPLQLLQQQQQQQQQPTQIQSRLMMGLGPAIGMANIGNNMVGLGGLGNVMGIGGARRMGGTGMSAPISGMGANMGQNPMNISQANAISQHIRAGTLNPQSVMAQKIKVAQAHSRMLGGTQAGGAGISGAVRQMQPGSAGLSMLGQTLNRVNINPMQRTMMGAMGQMGQMGQIGIPKLVPGMNVPMNQQQLQQQQMQPQPQQMQQQEATSPLQAVVSPQQVGSPSTLGIPQPMNQQQLTPQQQQASPQQMAQRTPMSPPLSSGPMHPMSAGNPEACPASPALSSQTLGSVGSITNSPMDLQGVNKSNSVT